MEIFFSFCIYFSEHKEMATWTSGLDVLDDLDKLSEFSAGCDHIKDIPIVAYSSYGRGSHIGDKETLRPPSPEVNMLSIVSPCVCNLRHLWNTMCTDCFIEDILSWYVYALYSLSINFLKVEEDFQLSHSFQPGTGRGERIIALSLNRQDLSLQQQLRMVTFYIFMF